MSTIFSTKFWVYGLCAVVILASVTWFLYDTDSQQETLALNNQSIDTGVALFNEKKFTEAIDILNSIPAGSSREWYALYYEGSAYIMLKDYQSAATHLEKALALNPTETRVMHALGVTYFKQGNLKLSKAYYASILEIDPGDEEARGLMDIMATLERQQPGEATPEPDAEKQP